jgi:ubiquinone/menaquinone biosynthesis C-methylase UbiE
MDDVVRTDNQTGSRQLPELPEGFNLNQPVSLVPYTAPPEIPSYLHDIYYWAYLNPRNVRLLDRDLVVSIVLWQQHRKLQRTAFAEINPGQSVLQSTCVYGSFSKSLAEHIGPQGSLDILDVAEVQVTGTRRKLEAYPHARVHHANALHLDGTPFDVVLCYFLLHEIPDEDKRIATNVLLNKVEPGGKVVFIDYHKPVWWHPLKPITSFIFDWLEPFAKGMWRNEIQDFAAHPEKFSWRKEPVFAGLFQKVVATRID